MEDPKITAHKETLKSMYVQIEKLLASSHTFRDIFNITATHGNHKYIFIYEKDGKTKKVTYVDYFANCYKYAAAIKKELSSVEPSSYVAFKLSNSPVWAYMFWGIIIAGYNPVIINPLYSNTDTNRLIKESGAKFIFAMKDEPCDVPAKVIGTLNITDEKFDAETWGTKVAFCTSGTTGDSKVFVFTDDNFVHMTYATKRLPDTSITAMYKSDKGDLRLMAVVPFAHIYGFVGVFLWYSFFGMTIVFPNSLSSADIQQCAIKHKVSHIYGVPLLWDSLTKSIKQTIASKSPKMQEMIKKFIDCNNHIITPAEAGFASTKMFRNIFQKKVFGKEIRFCVSGGAALSKETLYTINGIGYPLYNGYGMTEVGVTSVETIDSVEQRLRGSIGFPLTNVEYKIKNNELCIRAKQIHSYRLIDGKEIPAELDEEGYFHTGDIGVLDDTDHAWLKGKIKDVIIGANGENIYPDEIAVRFNGMPYVNKFTVVGIDVNGSETLTLIIYPEKGLNDEEIKELTDSISKINDTFPNTFKVRKALLSKEDLPVNTSMKIVKHELVEKYNSNPESFTELKIAANVSFDSFDKKDVKDVIGRIKKTVASVFGIKEEDIGESQNMITDLGGDSFVYMTLLSELESEFKLSVPTEMIGTLNTINDFALFVLKNKK